MGKRINSTFSRLVTNFLNLINFCQKYEKYNPAKLAYKIENLLQLHQNMGQIMQEHKSVETNLTNALIRRDQYQAALSERGDGIVGVMKMSDAPKTMVDRANVIVKKIKGYRITPAQEEMEEARQQSETGEGAKTKVKAGTTGGANESQQAFDKMLDNFKRLVELAVGLPTYASNEEELTIEGLNAFVAEADEVTSSLTLEKSNFKFITHERMLLFYEQDRGVVFVADGVKEYVRMVYKSRSREYKEVKELKFPKRRIKIKRAPEGGIITFKPKTVKGKQS